MRQPTARQQVEEGSQKVAHLPDAAEHRVVFRDGLGVRERRDSGTGELLEWFFLDPAFAAVEAPLRERVSRLANLQHVKFARVRSVEAARNGQGPVLVSSHVPGTRLSEVLEMSGHGLVTLEPGAGLQIARDVLAALTVLHASRTVTHGALAPERIVLTATGRVVMVEHVLAHALDRLHLPRHQLWRDWRIAAPPSSGPVRFDVRTDLAQAGVLILALLLARPLEKEEYPHRLRGLLPTVQDRLARSPASVLAADVVAWLARLVPVDSRRAFTTVREAHHAFEALVSGRTAAMGIAPARVTAVLLALAALEPGALETGEDAPVPGERDPTALSGPFPTPEVILVEDRAGDDAFSKLPSETPYAGSGSAGDLAAGGTEPAILAAGTSDVDPRVNWRRLVAPSVLLALFQGVAFAAWWWWRQ